MFSGMAILSERICQQWRRPETPGYVLAAYTGFVMENGGKATGYNSHTQEGTMQYRKLTEIKKLEGNPRIIRDKQLKRCASPLKTILITLRHGPAYCQTGRGSLSSSQVISGMRQQGS